MVKGIIFDKDGTLLDYEEFWVPVTENTVRSLLSDIDNNEKLVEEMLDNIGAYDGIEGTMCGGTYSEVAEKFNETMLKNGLGEISEEAVVKAFHENISCGKIVPVCENIAGVFERLKDMGIKVAVITSDNPEMTELCLDKLGIKEYMDKIYADDGINPPKPDPYYMKRFCEEFSLSPEELIMVGDTPTDMNFAKNGGAKAVGVAKKENNRNVLLKMTDTVIHDISFIFDVI